MSERKRQPQLRGASRSSHGVQYFHKHRWCFHQCQMFLYGPSCCRTFCGVVAAISEVTQSLLYDAMKSAFLFCIRVMLRFYSIAQQPMMLLNSLRPFPAAIWHLEPHTRLPAKTCKRRTAIDHPRMRPRAVRDEFYTYRIGHATVRMITDKEACVKVGR